MSGFDDVRKANKRRPRNRRCNRCGRREPKSGRVLIGLYELPPLPTTDTQGKSVASRAVTMCERCSVLTFGALLATWTRVVHEGEEP